MNGVFEDVSRETLEKLTDFEVLIRKWSPKINLVAKSTLADIRNRHIADSVETVRLVSGQVRKWVDLGSGGGLPGIVASIFHPTTDFVFIESDQRKSVFLRTAIRELGLRGTVISNRIEGAEPQKADIVSARALAPLPKLLGYCLRHADPGAVFLLPKGQSWREETKEAKKSYTFELEVYESVTQEGSVNLKIRNVQSV